MVAPGDRSPRRFQRSGSRRGGPDTGSVPETLWDPELAAAVREHGVAVPEERVAETLLDELAGKAASLPPSPMG
ncbi:Protein of unknown function C-terminus [Actinopolyspora alba]|uniref:DUF2399 domain-containing protein n=1 Tax=Actinopolyspora alba TaxID=673379 RepID=A0A1I2C178_9ACTN|nr:DUF2399 domain-containing protein [Actinopolyspora alba]SFE61493.1 Protein of unknown function C-terminus [Actinopolyspora alba]